MPCAIAIGRHCYISLTILLKTTESWGWLIETIQETNFWYWEGAFNVRLTNIYLHLCWAVGIGDGDIVWIVEIIDDLLTDNLLIVSYTVYSSQVLMGWACIWILYIYLYAYVYACGCGMWQMVIPATNITTSLLLLLGGAKVGFEGLGLEWTSDQWSWSMILNLNIKTQDILIFLDNFILDSQNEVIINHTASASILSDIRVLQNKKMAGAVGTSLWWPLKLMFDIGMVVASYHLNFEAGKDCK